MAHGDYTLEHAKHYLDVTSPGPGGWGSQVIEWSRQGAAADDSMGYRRAFGIIAEFNTLQQLHNAVNQGNARQVVILLNKIKSSAYGAFGTPYRGNLPGKLDDNIQLTLSAPKARIDAIIKGVESGDGSIHALQKSLDDMYSEGRDMLGRKAPKNARLTEVRPGTFQWTGWEDNPEWKAYREGMAEHRRSAAQAKQAAGQQRGAMPTLQSSGQYAQLQDLFAAHEGGGGARPGQTPATKPGAVPYSDTPGFVGMQAAAYSPSAKEPDDYEY